MIAAVMVLGLVAEAVAWWAVATKRRSVWAVMTPVLVGMGIAALLVGSPRLAGRVSVGLAAAVGLGTGVVLYLATRLFVVVVGGWTAFQRQSVQIYGRRGSLPLVVLIALSAVVLVAGEELFWRGLFQAELASRDLGRLGAAATTWLAFVAANLPSLNLAIVAGAVVGGAVWTALAFWSGGFLASLCCHSTWTALMLAFPAVRPSQAVEA